jgi:hypothetical protein
VFELCTVPVTSEEIIPSNRRRRRGRDRYR